MLVACSQNTQVKVTETEATQPTQSASNTAPDTYNAKRQYEKFAQVPMDVDISFLSASEKAVVNKLIEASGYLSDIYLRQRGENYPALREEIKSKGTATQLEMFDLHFGPCDPVTASKTINPFMARCPAPKAPVFTPPI